MAATYGSHDAGVCARSFNARALALAGRADEAVQMIEEAIALARRLGHPFSEALTLVFAATVRQALRDAPAAKRHATEAAAIAREQDFWLLSGWAAVIEGWALVEHGQVEDGVRKLSAGIEGVRATGSDQFLSHFMGLLAESCLKNGRTSAGFEALDEAEAVARRTGERFYEAELYRLRGELQLAEHTDDARARAQGALLLALRAAVSLGRLWNGANRAADAQRLVETALDDLGCEPDAADAAALLRSTSRTSD